MTNKLLILFVLIALSSSAYAMDSASYVFTGKDAAEVVGRALMKEGAGDEVKVQINNIRNEDNIAAASSSAIIAEADALHIDRAHRSWEATLLLTSDGKSLAPVQISGHYDEMMHIPVLKSQIQPGDIITEEDIVWDDVPTTRIRKSTITDSKELVGKAPKHVVSAGRPVRLDEITGPTVVSKGSQVTLIYKTASIEIKTLGEAMESGAQGTVIRVKNIASKSVIQGTVEGEGRVRIHSPDSVSAELM